ncbi:TA system VapC family ribonuclease toxin [Variovorax sp. LARHSF232]
MTPDVNVLVAASRSDHPHHAVARQWLEKALADASIGPSLAIQPMVIASFLRLVTNAKVFLNPTPIAAALEFADAVLGSPGVERPQLGGEWTLLRDLCSAQQLTANDIPDAWLAAAVMHQGEHLVTFDGDFKRLLTRAQFTRLAR